MNLPFSKAPGRAGTPLPAARRMAAFTMVEIAICLAIIGIALVGIIGVLPIGMNTQRDTREETIVNQDVSTLLPIISQGLRGDDDLTNYIYAITNYWGYYKYDGTLLNSGAAGYTTTSGSGGSFPPYVGNFPPYYFSPVQLTNGANIVGLLSTPQYIANAPYYPAVPELINNAGEYNVFSNHMVAYVHALSGLASEKPPQDNELMVNDAFTYKLLVVNSSVAMDTNNYDAPYNQQLWKNQHELRLSFFYPLQPNGSVGPNQLTFRTTVAGQLSPSYVNGQDLYFYQPRSFGMNTNQ